MLDNFFVTSFSAAGYEQYGKRFLQDFIANFPKNTRMAVFYEGEANRPAESDPRIWYFDLHKDYQLISFLKRHEKSPIANGIVEQNGQRSINYRYQATKFVNKVAALTSGLLPSSSWRIWIDADVTVDKPIPEDFFNFLNPEHLAAYIGREGRGWDHSECGFVAYNTATPQGKAFLADFRDMYMADKIFMERETHDSWIFDVLRHRYEANGSKFFDIASGSRKFHPWPHTILGQYMTHNKGPKAKEKDPKAPIDVRVHSKGTAPRPSAPQTNTLPASPIVQTTVAPPKRKTIAELVAGCTNRYQQLYRICGDFRPRRVVEVGTYNGDRAIELCIQTLQAGIPCHYIGFDVFEGATPELNAKELNAKGPCDYKNITEKLQAFSAKWGGKFTFDLVKGLTKDTMPTYNYGEIDLAFIDGGHSIETILNDYNCLKNVTKLIIFDDYYIEGGVYDISKFGCNEIVKNIPHTILPIADVLSNPGDSKTVTIACIAAGPLIEGQLPGGHANQSQIKIKTQNCVPNDNIKNNIRHSARYARNNVKTIANELNDKFNKGELTFDQYTDELHALKNIEVVKFLPRICKSNKLQVVIIGGGQSITKKEHPDYEKHWKEVRKLAKKPNVRIAAVKTSYDLCVSEGVIPAYCSLLDPRDHVSAAIKNPQKETTFIIASMCHPSTWDRFVQEGFKVVGYHAAVFADETPLIIELFPNDKWMISGGTTAGYRGIAVFYTMGFRKIITYGLDSSYNGKPDKVHGRNKEKPAIEVNVHGKQFWTDPELIAQSNDMEAHFKMFPTLEIEYKGDGMLQHGYSILTDHIKKMPGDRTLILPTIAPYLNYYNANDEAGEILHLDGLIYALQKRREVLNAGLDTLDDFETWLNKK